MNETKNARGSEVDREEVGVGVGGVGGRVE